ncbi:MAG: NAD(P)-binding domain-containing protein [Cohnella sp.]|nr:NAD(P)-binding domain-containing protein [Cohnella sp.]
MIRKEILIIGGGQAGIALGYYLRLKGADFAILDANLRTGDSWRGRYDSLRLFTPRQYSGLPGYSFPGDPRGAPTKDEAADYLEAYVDKFDLPVIYDTRIVGMKRVDGGFYLRSDSGEEFQADRVVVATGPFHRPFVPDISRFVGEDVVQIHSSVYRNAKDLQPGSTLVVGGGNSGAQIAVELAADREVTIAVSEPLSFKPLTILGKSMFWYYEKLGFMRAKMTSARGLLMQRQPNSIYGLELRGLLDRNRVSLKPRASTVDGDRVIFNDGSSAKFRNIVWATGFRSDYDWIRIEGLFHEDGTPKHRMGETEVPGLYFLGLAWQTCRGSALMGWVKHDAEYVAEKLFPQRGVRASGD